MTITLSIMSYLTKNSKMNQISVLYIDSQYAWKMQTDMIYLHEINYIFFQISDGLTETNLIFV